MKGEKVEKRGVAKVEPQLRIANCVIYTAPRPAHSPTRRKQKEESAVKRAARRAERSEK